MKVGTFCMQMKNSATSNEQRKVIPACETDGYKSYFLM
jgi:hypothetical protein